MSNRFTHTTPTNKSLPHQFPISSPMSLVQIFPKAATINKIKYNFHMHFNTHKLFQGSMTINNRMKHFLIGEMIHRWIIMCIKYKLQSRLNSIKMIFNRKMAIINKSSQLCLVSENLQKILEIFFNFNPNIFFLYIQLIRGLYYHEQAHHKYTGSILFFIFVGIKYSFFYSSTRGSLLHVELTKTDNT